MPPMVVNNPLGKAFGGGVALAKAPLDSYEFSLVLYP